MKALCAVLLVSAFAAGCTQSTSSGVPGTKNLTVAVNSNCIGTVKTVHVKVNAADYADILPGGSNTQALAPAYYSIRADADNGKHWEENVTLTADHTFDCGCQ